MRERDLDSQGLSLRAATRDGVARLTVEGELDMASSPILERAVEGALESARAVELELSGVSFMDSTGLRTLLAIRRRLEEADCELRLIAVPPPVLRVLDVTRTASLFRLDPVAG
jgi:anti-sigma B factor antagonist